ncbi:hypothetical protein Pan153_03650 [Gimesia panareensis]|uniref:Uncharacterized protein n=1 Tax=Gimesia panareensis TaxID=2527978 RepID=A0A518FHC9_9PLAN|nr:hypothetical protein Pan153_03650 [Gimesia panareensis]
MKPWLDRKKLEIQEPRKARKTRKIVPIRVASDVIRGCRETTRGCGARVLLWGSEPHYLELYLELIDYTETSCSLCSPRIVSGVTLFLYPVRLEKVLVGVW